MLNTFMGITRIKPSSLIKVRLLRMRKYTKKCEKIWKIKNYTYLCSVLLN